MSLPKLIDTGIYAATYWSAVSAFTLGWGFRATGRQNVPRHGPALIVSNHQSFLDPVLIGAAAPRRLTYLARSSLFDHPFLAGLIRHFSAVPIDRGFGKEGLQTVLAQLHQGRAVLMFPEGERTHSGDVQPLKPGVSLLIRRLTCPIIPAAVAGCYQSWPRHQAFPIPEPISLPPEGRSLAVAFGPAIDPATYQGQDRDTVLQNLRQQIILAKLAAEQIRRRSNHSRCETGRSMWADRRKPVALTPREPYDRE